MKKIIDKLSSFFGRTKSDLTELNRHPLVCQFKDDVQEYWKRTRRSSAAMYVLKGAAIGLVIGLLLPFITFIGGAVLGGLVAGGILLYKHVLDQSRPQKDLPTLLKELEELLAKDLITKEEFEVLRKKLVEKHT